MSRTTLAAAVLALALTGCSGSADEPADPDRIVLTPAEDGAAGHTHAPGQGHAEGGPVGDGTEATVGAYSMTDVALPAADGVGPMSFVIRGAGGTPVTSYVEEQTKLLHLYVVREDLSSFRHLHPTLGDDGVWRTSVDLGTPGPWRVVAEFMPDDATRPVVLGTTVEVPGEGAPVEVPRGDEAREGDDGVVAVRMLDDGVVGPDGRLQMEVTTVAGEPVTLGSYLGAAAHVTGFAIDDTGFVHVHPYGEPEVTDDGTVLTFHTTFTTPGEYRLFVQVRVDGLLHQVPVTALVNGPAA